MKNNIYFLLGVMFFLSGCMSLKPIETVSINTYTLSAHSKPLRANHTSKTLLVSLTKAAPGFNTSDMRYVKKKYQLMSFAQNRWVAPPAEMINPLIVQSLQNTHHYRAVAAPPFFANFDLRLDTQLLTLQQEFLQSPSQVRLVLQASLVNAKTLQIIATKRFQIIKTTGGNDPYHGVLAANRAVSEMMYKLAKFCIR